MNEKQPEDVTDEQIREAAVKAVKAGKLSWSGFDKDDQDKYTIPVLSKSHYQFARAILSLRPVQVPMTDEQIRSMCKQGWVFETVRQWVHVIEAHHGITAQTKKEDE